MNERNKVLFWWSYYLLCVVGYYLAFSGLVLKGKEFCNFHYPEDSHCLAYIIAGQFLPVGFGPDFDFLIKNFVLSIMVFVPMFYYSIKKIKSAR